MQENTFKKEENKKEKKSGKRRMLFGLLDGSFLESNNVLSLMPFLFFLTFMAMIIIFNTYYAEKKARKIETLRTENLELHLKYITIKSELMYISNQSVVASKLEEQGFVESVNPPIIIRSH